MQLNTDMVDASEGLMAPVTGLVRYASFAAWHFVGFCRAANARTITPETDLQESDGRVDTARPEKDPVLKTSFETGWKWLVLPASVELQWPEFLVVNPCRSILRSTIRFSFILKSLGKYCRCV